MPANSSTGSIATASRQLAVGKARYGLMLREDGIVLDDGTTSRLADDHFFMTTTTANAAQGHDAYGILPPGAVARARCAICLGHRAMGADGGRRAQGARDARRRSSTMSTLNDETFPYLAAKEIIDPRRHHRRGCSASRSRASMPMNCRCRPITANMAARALMQAGEEFGIVPYGVEALSVMRIEKGHVAGGELNGTTTAGDLGLGQDDVDEEGLYRPHDGGARRPGRSKDREHVVGIRPVDTGDRLRAGSHLLKRNDAPSTGQRPGLYHLGRLFADARLCGWAWRCSRTGASAMARSSRSSTGCATSTCMPRSAIPCITTRRTGSSMLKLVDRHSARLALWPMLRCRAASAPTRARPASPCRCAIRCRSSPSSRARASRRRSARRSPRLTARHCRRPENRAAATACRFHWCGADQWYAIADGCGGGRALSRAQGSGSRALPPCSDQSHGRIILRVAGPEGARRARQGNAGRSSSFASSGRASRR